MDLEDLFESGEQYNTQGGVHERNLGITTKTYNLSELKDRAMRSHTVWILFWGFFAFTIGPMIVTGFYMNHYQSPLLLACCLEYFFLYGLFRLFRDIFMMYCTKKYDNFDGYVALLNWFEDTKITPDKLFFNNQSAFYTIPPDDPYWKKNAEELGITQHEYDLAQGKFPREMKRRQNEIFDDESLSAPERYRRVMQLSFPGYDFPVPTLEQIMEPLRLSTIDSEYDYPETDGESSSGSSSGGTTHLREV